MYLLEIEIKDMTENTTSAPYLDSLLLIGRDSNFYTYLYDKRDHLNVEVTNLSFLSSKYSIFACLWRFYFEAYTVCKGFVLLQMFYSEGQNDF